MLTYVIIIAVFFTVLIVVVSFILIIRSYRSASNRTNPDGTTPKWGLFSRANGDDGLCWDSFDIYQGSQGIASNIFMSRCVGIQPRTYDELQKSEEEIAEITSFDGVVEEEAPNPPKVKFTLKYDTIRSTLIVHVLGVQNVPKRAKGDVAYYITLRIFPQPYRTFHTRAIESGNPLQFNELYEFEIMEPNLLDQSLKLILSYFDRFSQHEVFGDLKVELGELESRGLTLSREILLCKELSKVVAEHTSNGEIMLSLGYLRLTERLAVVVILVKDLPLLKTGSKPDPYVEINVLHGRRTSTLKRTSSKAKDCNPVFNESLTFHIPHGILHQSSLLISIKNDEGIDSNDVILGQVLLGAEASGIQFEHWNEMRVNNKPIARWHKLQAR